VVIDGDPRALEDVHPDERVARRSQIGDNRLNRPLEAVIERDLRRGGQSDASGEGRVHDRAREGGCQDEAPRPAVDAERRQDRLVLLEH
jgi:hypothetical protein